MFIFTRLGCSFLSTYLPLTIPPNNSQYIYICMCGHLSEVKVAQSRPTLFNLVDCTVHGILQARILEWVAVPFSRGSSQLRDWTQVSHIAGRFFTRWATREAQYVYIYACICTHTLFLLGMVSFLLQNLTSEGFDPALSRLPCLEFWGLAQPCLNPCYRGGVASGAASPLWFPVAVFQHHHWRKWLWSPWESDSVVSVVSFWWQRRLLRWITEWVVFAGVRVNLILARMHWLSIEQL